MRTFLSILFIFIVQSAIGQSEEYLANLNPYLRYQFNTYECGFKSKDKEILAYCDTLRYCNNFLTSSFNSDSTYSIELTLIQKTGEYRDKQFLFEGRYEIDEERNIVLKGAHPFTSNTLRIKEQNRKYYIYTLGYKFKLNDEFNWTNKRRLSAYCDGNCMIEKIE